MCLSLLQAKLAELEGGIRELDDRIAHEVTSRQDELVGQATSLRDAEGAVQVTPTALAKRSPSANFLVYTVLLGDIGHSVPAFGEKHCVIILQQITNVNKMPQKRLSTIAFQSHEISKYNAEHYIGS